MRKDKGMWGHGDIEFRLLQLEIYMKQLLAATLGEEPDVFEYTVVDRFNRTHYIRARSYIRGDQFNGIPICNAVFEDADGFRVAEFENPSSITKKKIKQDKKEDEPNT
jgi:hypothetical protein